MSPTAWKRGLWVEAFPWEIPLGSKVESLRVPLREDLIPNRLSGYIRPWEKEEGMADKLSYPEKVVSGGQTGVDRAALDVALELGIPCGGWCPKGRRAEDGPIAARYPLRETDSTEYPVRTERNVKDSDGTLILNLGPLEGGTALTLKFARTYNKPHLVLDLSEPGDPAFVREWLRNEKVCVLNVAGPPESARPGIYAKALEFLKTMLQDR